MKVCYTASDALLAMVRGEVCVTVESWDDACSEDVWNRVKSTFARRHRTKKEYVDITAVRVVPDDYKPMRG